MGATLVAFPIPAGIHVLSWNANTFYDTGSSPDDAGWLDDVVYTPAYQAASPVTLLNPRLVGANLQFAFLSQAAIPTSSNTTPIWREPIWMLYSAIIGDGTTKTVTVPVNTPIHEFFRVDTQ